MIISASRRTDIPAFYSEWFMNRIGAGYCAVPNPFNSKQISRVPLDPDDVDVIVFWTRNPQPLIPHLSDLDDLGYRYYFQYTILGYPREIDPKSPGLESAIATFQKLADQIGQEKVIWRYDPILFSDLTGTSYHQEQYHKIAESLRGYTERSVISIVDLYRKNRGRLKELSGQGVNLKNIEPTSQEFANLIKGMVAEAQENQMSILSCAETIDLRSLGVKHGKCIDDDLIQQVFDLTVTKKKDPNQREICGCAISKDIGMYDTCIYECPYCYATRSIKMASVNYQDHQVDSPSLIGWFDPPQNLRDRQLKML